MSVICGLCGYEGPAHESGSGNCVVATLARIEKAERELGTELLANAGLLHQLAEAERERDGFRIAAGQTINAYRMEYEADQRAEKADATIARIEALVLGWEASTRPSRDEAKAELKAALKGDA